jgi:hypothetical protein
VTSFEPRCLFQVVFHRYAWLALSACSFGACLPGPYVQPAPNEPHALLKMKHIVHAKRGPIYGASTSLANEVIDERALSTAQHELSTNTWAIRVRPEVATYAVGGHSYHMEQRTVQKSRQVPESYSCPQTQCNYSSSASGPGGTQCQTVYNTCTRYHTEYYTEQQTVSVDDDACARRVTFAPNVGHTYAIQFDYLGDNNCQALCFEETPGGQLVTCPIVPATR